MKCRRWWLFGLLLGLATCQSHDGPGVGPDSTPGMVSLSVLAPSAASVPATSGVVRVTGNGVDITRTLNPGQSSSLDVPPGTYTLVLAGLSNGAVVSLGQRTGIEVRSGAATEATVQLQSFVSDPPDAPANASAGEAFTARWNAVFGASGYELEWSPRSDFGAVVQRQSTSQSSLEVTLSSDSVYFFRVRALTDALPMSGHWSEASAGTGVVVVDPPVIALAADSVGFSGRSGADAPPPQTVAVTNGGGQTLSGLSAVVTGYDAGQPTGWLVVSLDREIAPASLRLIPDIEDLDPGRYAATVEVRSSLPGVGVDTLRVTLEVSVATIPPSIQLNVSRRIFAAQQGGANPEAQFVEVVNAGGGSLDGLGLTVIGSGAPPDGWLTAALDTTSAPATITLQPDIRGLAVGNYSTVLQVNAQAADNSPRSVEVVLSVREAPVPPTIRLTPDSVSFEAMQGRDPPDQTVRVENGGAGTLERLGVEVVSYGDGAAGWLEVDPAGSTAPVDITLRASTDGLEVGTYSALVEVGSPQADNTPQRFPVTLTVSPGPPIGVSPDSVAFTTEEGQDPASRTVSITNAGDGTLGGLAVSVGGYAGGASGWLDAALSSPTAPSTLTLTPDADGLDPGVYTATVNVSSRQAGNSPQSVAVTLTVTAAPPDTFTVAVSASPTEGGTASGAGSFVDGSSVTVVAEANSGYTFTRWTEDGTGVSTSASYTFTIAGARTLVAEFARDPEPTIGVSPDSVAFTTEEGQDPPARTVAITNAGDGSLGGLAVSVGGYGGGASGWLDAALGSPTAPSTLTLTADSEGLDPGVYTATVSVSSAQAVNSPRAVAVTLTVTAAPPDTFTVAVSASPTEGGTASGGGSFIDGSSVTVVAEANSGYTFTRWAEGGTGVSTSASYTFTIADDRTLVAEFATVSGPAIGLSTDSVGFVTEEGEDPDPDEQEVTITNLGQGTLAGLQVSVGGWTGGASGWLEVELGRGRAPTTITLETDDADDLDPGVYTAVVTVSSSQALNSPQFLRVTLTVTPESSNVSLDPLTSSR